MTNPATGDPSTEVVVYDAQSAQRYEIRVGGELAGLAAYRAVTGRIIFTHTEIRPAFEGRGLGSRLAAGALDDVRARGLRVTPLCPFIAGYIERHPAYADLVVRPGQS